MKYSRLLSAGLTIALCLGVAAPGAVNAASKISSAKSRVIQKKNSRAANSRAAETRLKKSRIISDRKAGKNDKTAKNGGSDRDVWLRRAQGGDLLSGLASWYGKDFHNKATASGHKYDMYTFTAAHRTLPMGTVVRVTDPRNGKSVMVCVTDRGPYVRGRIIDLSYAAARQLDLGKRGVGRVNLEVVSDATGKPLNEDKAYYVRYNAAKGREKVGPFRIFADAAAMHEALSQAHPEAEMVLERTR